MADAFASKASRRASSFPGGGVPLIAGASNSIAASKVAAPSSNNAPLGAPTARLPPRVAVDNPDSRVDKALRVRLYLLRQGGPSSFVVCSDSTEIKHQVLIGPQTCTCGRDYCVHLLFVMLRVLMVPRTSPTLWAKPLKDFETEQLLRAFQEHRSAIIYPQRTQRMVRAGGSAGQPRTVEEVMSASNGASAEDGEWEFAPKADDDVPCAICLLEMVDEESLTFCRKGCGNRFHQHCMRIWTEERTSKGKKACCPLCRCEWKEVAAPSQASNPGTTAVATTTSAPTDTTPPPSRAVANNLALAIPVAVPAPATPCADGATSGTDSGYSSTVSSPAIAMPECPGGECVDETARGGEVAGGAAAETALVAVAEAAPPAGPNPTSLTPQAILGAPLFAAVSASNWIPRETAVKSLSQTLAAAIAAGDADIVRRSLDGASTEPVPAAAVLEAVCGVIAKGIADPVARVHQSAAGALSSILAAEDMPLGVPAPLAKRALSVLLDAVTSRVSDTNKRIGSASLSLACRLSLDPRWGASAVVPYVLDLSRSVGADGKPWPWRWWHARLLLALNLLSQSPSALIDMRRGEPVLRNALSFAVAALAIRHARVGRRAVDLIVECCAVAEQIPSLLPDARGAVAQLQPAMSRSVASRLAKRRMHRTTVKSRATSSPRKQSAGGAPSSSTAKEFKWEEDEESEDEPEEEAQPEKTCAELVKDEEEQEERARRVREVRAGELLDGLAVAVSRMHLAKDVVSDVYPCVPAGLFAEGTAWTLKQRLGRGGNASVHLGEDPTGRQFAVKRVDGACATALERDSALRSASREAAILRTLNHPNVIACLGGVYEASGDADCTSPCARVHAFRVDLFLELMTGGTLSGLVSRVGALPLGRVRHYARQLVSAVAHMHSRGIIHRDIKCANILLSHDFSVAKISDFGSSSRLTGCLTMTGEFTAGHFGTVAFMAPEVIRGEPHGRSCDVWSLGCAILQMATGRIPWTDAEPAGGSGEQAPPPNNYTLMYRIAAGRDLPAFPEDCDADLYDILSRCIVRSPSSREHAQALLEHPFLTALDGDGEGAAPTVTPNIDVQLSEMSA